MQALESHDTIVYMPISTIQIKNNTLNLPPSLRKGWQNAEVYVSGVGDTLIIKKLARPVVSFKDMVAELQRATKTAKLSKRDVARVIQETRREMYK